MTEMYILLASAASFGFIHTIVGPDHYLPFIVLSKARKWSQAKTLWITFISGIGHVASSVLIGFIGIFMGIGLHKLEAFEAGRGDLVAWLLMFFGLAYIVFSIFKYYKPNLHAHLPQFLLPKSIRKMNAEIHNNVESKDEKDTNITPWILFLIFVFGPCEVLIPLLIFPAYQIHVAGMIMVSLVFGVVTVATMMVLVYLGLKGINSLKTRKNERHFHLAAGIVILVLGLGMNVFGW
jgi:sulfite exporter TauE/SafE